MKINIFMIVLMFGLLFATGASFAAEDMFEDETYTTVDPWDFPESPDASETPKAGEGAFNEDDFYVHEMKDKPVATVSEDARTDLKAAGIKGEKIPPKSSSKILPEKKGTGVKTKPEAASSSLDQAQMAKHWKALFSKEITPDSVAYVVKPGDSLYVLARRNHTTVDLIKKINGLESDKIFPKMTLKIHTAPFSILIDKSKNTLVLYSDNAPVKKYSVATGRNNSTPVGKFKITDKLVDPTWFKTGAILPPGSPENGLGTRWMGFDKPAYGIHGTIDPKSIGTQASEGCVRMLNEDVEELYSLVPSGTKVIIQD